MRISSWWHWVKSLSFTVVSLSSLNLWAIRQYFSTWMTKKKPRLSKLSKSAWIANDRDEHGWWMVWFQSMETETDWYMNHETFNQHNNFEICIKCSYYNLCQTSHSFLARADSSSRSNIHPLHRLYRLTEKANSWASLYFVQYYSLLHQIILSVSNTVFINKIHSRICDGRGNLLANQDSQFSTSSINIC